MHRARADAPGGEGASQAAANDATPPRAPTHAPEPDSRVCLVTFFPNDESLKLKDGKAMFAYLASDVYLKSRKGKDPRPRKLTDFRGCEEQVLLERLADDKTSADVEEAVKCERFTHKKRGESSPGLVISGRVRKQTASWRRIHASSTTSQPDIVLVFSSDSEDLCRKWVDALRWRLTPHALHRKQAAEKYRQRCTDDPGLLLEEFGKLYEVQGGGEPGQEPSSAAIVERLNARVSELELYKKVIDIANALAQGTTKVIHGSSKVSHEAARVLGGVSLIGPVVSSITLCFSLAELCARVREDSKELRQLRRSIPEIEHRLTVTLFMTLRADPDSNIVKETFEALEECWALLNKAERHLMSKTRSQLWGSEHARNVRAAAERLEHRRQLTLRDQNIVRTLAKVERNSANIRDIERRLAGSMVDGRRLKATFGVVTTDPRIVENAFRHYEDIRLSLRKGGMIALSDSRAQEHEAAEEGECQFARSHSESLPQSSVPVAALDGAGGYGKTTCLQLLANDPEVLDTFAYVLFIELGQGAGDAGVVEKLAQIAYVVHPGARHDQSIRDLPKGSRQVSQAVDILQPLLSKARTLLILDNVCHRRAGDGIEVREWTLELSSLLSDSSKDAMIISTRIADLAAGPGVKRFTFTGVTGEAATTILKSYAGNEAVSGKDAALFDSIAKEVCLPLCNGWPLPLAICGTLLKKNIGRWRDLMEHLKDMIGESEQNRLDVLIRTSLSYAQMSLKSYTVDRVIFRKQADLRKEFESLKLADLYKCLAALSSRSPQVPTFALGLLFGVSDEAAEEVASVLGDYHLATITDAMEGSPRTLVLHELLHAFAHKLWRSPSAEVESGGDCRAMSVASAHGDFVRAAAARFCSGAESLGDAAPEWSMLCENKDTHRGAHNLATYVCEEIVHHVVEATRASAQEPLFCTWPHGSAQVLQLLCSYPWIRERGNVFGRAGVLGDLVTAVEAVRREEEDAVLRGASHALTAILNVLQLVSHERFRQDAGAGQDDSSSGTNGATGDGDSSAQTFTERYMPDSGLAGELYGRLAMIKFKRVDEVARPYALQVAAMLQKSIQESARPPWLCPRNECYLSSESSEDECCVAAFSVSGGHVGGVAYVRVGGESLLLSGGDEGSLWVHNERDPGRSARELTGHDGDLTSVVATGREAGGAAGNVLAASCSADGTVRLWGCENGAAKGEVRSLHTLETSSGEKLVSMDLTPDAARVVAGGYNGKDKECCVHVWTRRSAGAAAAARGADAYAAIALSGHKSYVAAVAVSRTGERVVSASDDGTVRVWRVVMDTAVGPSHKLVSWAGDDCDKPRWPRTLALAADARTVYVGDLYRSDIPVVDCKSAREVAALQSDNVGSDVYSLALLESSGGGASGRLFVGHVNGVISEWDVAKRTCSAVYGDPESRARSIVECITARFLEQASDGDEAVARSESTRAEPRVTGAAAGTGGGPGGDDALGGAEQSRVEFAAGYRGGAVRVWRAGSGYVPGENCAAEAAAGVGERAVERHADTPGDWPVSLAVSGDGRWLVSGSQEGVLCVWDTGSGACVATLRGHKAYINGIDVSGDGTVIASCGSDGIARVWTLQSSREWDVSANLGHDRDMVGVWVSCVVMTADTRHAITGDCVGEVRVWNASTGQLCGRGWGKHSRHISSLAVLQGGAARSGAKLVFASRDEDRTCVLWSLSSKGDLACEEEASEVPDEINLGRVFSSCAALAPLPACWYEQRGYYSLAYHFVFNGGGRGGTRRYDVAARKDGTELLVFENKNDSPTAVCLDSDIACFTCFQRQEGGDKCLVVCCGLENGIVAMFDLIPRTS